MSNTEFLTIKINGILKNDFQKFCKGIGISVNSAIKLLVKRCISEKRIFFEIVSPDDLQLEAWSMTGQDNKISIRIEEDLRMQFLKTCKEDIGTPMSTVIRLFMIQCIINGRLPFDTT